MKYIIQDVLLTIQAKFSKFGDLLLRDKQTRKEAVTVHGLPGMGKDLDSKVARPGRKIPNIRDFAISLKPFDGLFLLFGFEKRSAPELSFFAHKNAPANRYIDYMFKRLAKQVELGLFEEASTTIWILMKSTSYRVAAFNSVVRNWHRKYPLWMIEDGWHEIGHLINTKATKIDYRRVYLNEKVKIRPLGVPTVPGRVYLHMYNNLLTQGRLVSEQSKQHGYLPGRGVVSFGNELVKKLERPNIYEADFQGFFDNVTHTGILDELENIGVPSLERGFLHSLCISTVKLNEEPQIQESVEDLMGQMKRNWETFVKKQAPKSVILDGDEVVIFDDPHKLPDNVIVIGDEIFVLDEPVDDSYRDVPTPFHLGTPIPKEKGVPQGAPISCSLATLTLRPLENDEDILLYADDVLGFPDSTIQSPSEILDMPVRGVMCKPAKTQGIKLHGVWLVDSFKMLGIRYYPRVFIKYPNNFMRDGLTSKGFELSGVMKGYRKFASDGYWRSERFVAETRNGANLEFTRREAFLSYLFKARDLMLDYSESSLGKNYFFNKPLSEGLQHNYMKFEKLKSAPKLLGNNPLTGGFTARMYANSGDLKAKQDFNLTYRRDSGVALIGPLYITENKENLRYDDISVFTASTFACHDLFTLFSKEKKKEKFSFRKVTCSSRFASKSENQVRTGLAPYLKGYVRSIRKWRRGS